MSASAPLLCMFYTQIRLGLKSVLLSLCDYSFVYVATSGVYVSKTVLHVFVTVLKNWEFQCFERLMQARQQATQPLFWSLNFHENISTLCPPCTWIYPFSVRVLF
jgi:hypothetical protein